jgi:hypothetical protein
MLRSARHKTSQKNLSILRGRYYGFHLTQAEMNIIKKETDRHKNKRMCVALLGRLYKKYVISDVSIRGSLKKRESKGTGVT